jgi:integrase
MESKGSPHGWRPTFRTWGGDTGVDREVAESALAHKAPDVDPGIVSPGLRRSCALMEKARLMD